MGAWNKHCIYLNMNTYILTQHFSQNCLEDQVSVLQHVQVQHCTHRKALPLKKLNRQCRIPLSLVQMEEHVYM